MPRLSGKSIANTSGGYSACAVTCWTLEREQKMPLAKSSSELDPIPQFRATAKLGEFLEVHAVLLGHRSFLTSGCCPKQPPPSPFLANFHVADHLLGGCRCLGWECARETSSILIVGLASGLPPVSRQFQSVSKLPEGSQFSKVTVWAFSFHSFWQRPSLALAVAPSRIPDRPPQTLSRHGTFRG